jgi:hypothetical protein
MYMQAHHFPIPKPQPIPWGIWPSRKFSKVLRKLIFKIDDEVRGIFLRIT